MSWPHLSYTPIIPTCGYRVGGGVRSDEDDDEMDGIKCTYATACQAYMQKQSSDHQGIVRVRTHLERDGPRPPRPGLGRLGPGRRALLLPPAARRRRLLLERHPLRQLGRRRGRQRPPLQQEDAAAAAAAAPGPCCFSSRSRQAGGSWCGRAAAGEQAPHAVLEEWHGRGWVGLDERDCGVGWIVGFDTHPKA